MTTTSGEVLAAAGTLPDMAEGYLDGFGDDRDEMPTSLDNRSHSYRHGWLCGRDDRLGKPRDTAANLRLQADLAEARDATMRGELPKVGEP